ncbi:DUF4031 domain-containing protein [Nonomuraea turcica]|uniref:DUF4031 domain-containing protein n=1 Tax=Nonomuraea sp. G32 TaxID=3067274 RepID=UPI00273C2B89|nr:DUF4031 domain-containing protein [Nonomuraea sp. G32]MDP4501009.1 DUF4031 domain-containing protein [Nonomuraea sp. G32]
MTVYVDDWRQQATVGRHTSRWSHLFSDTSDEELHEFAASIGLKRAWFQKANDPLQLARHYDVSESKRRAAVAAGAVEISWRDAGRMRSVERERLRGEKAGDR